MRTDSKGRDIFYGVVAIATLIVAIIGATLAYFSITASSEEGAVGAVSATVSIEYNDGQQVTAQADKLIPATLDVVKQVYEETIKPLGTEAWVPENEEDTLSNYCTDRNDRQVCSAYRFTIKSDIERDISATLKSESNSFTYLSYAVYDVTNQTWLTLDDDEDIPLSLCSNDGENAEEKCFTVENDKKQYNEALAVNSIFGYTIENGVSTYKSVGIASATQIFDLVLFIKETNENQNIDQGKEYHGTIAVEVVEGDLGTGQITGCVGDDCVE